MEYTLYVDVSGSVGGFTNYWNQVEKVYNNYKNQINQIYVWDDKIQLSTKSNFESLINRKYGGGGTSPYLIAKNLTQQNIKKNIIIFTDGDVGDHDVQKADNHLGSHQIDNVECYIIGKSNANLSVTCPFTRNNDSTVYWTTDNTELTKQVFTKPDPQFINTIDLINLETFNEKYSQLESYIIAKNMGKSGDSFLKEKLIKLKKKLANELAMQSNIGNNYGLKIRQMLELNDFDSALAIAKNMNFEYFESDIGMEIEKKVGYLINLCGDLRGQYSINQIRSNRMPTAENVKKETSTEVEVEINDLISKPVECPIMMDTDVPQIMIVNTGEPVLANLEKHIVDDIISCPLRILNYPVVVAKLKPSISQWTGIQVNQHLDVNPFTKQELLGTIPLGSCSQHVDCGNYTISKLFTSGKLLGNLNMYWAVIWYLIKQNTWEYLSDIKDQVTEHLMYRLKSSNTFASLTGLPQYVLTKVPTDVAVWYCVNSCLLNPPTDRDTCRLHLFNMQPMLEMLKELNYPISDKTIQQINRTQVLMSMLSICKKNNEQFRNKMTCLVQNAIKINLDQVPDYVKTCEGNLQWIPTDGSACQEQIDEILETLPKFYLNLSVNELVGLSKMVNPQLSASAIQLSPNWEPEPTTPVINWSLYSLNNIQVPTDEVQICPYTFRPYYTIKYNGIETSWVEKVSKQIGPIDQVFSGCKRFIDFIYKYKMFPNFSSFILFCYNRYKTQYSTPTLPFTMSQIALDVLTYYTPISKIVQDKNIDFDQVIKILQSSCSIENRMKLEAEYKKDTAYIKIEI